MDYIGFDTWREKKMKFQDLYLIDNILHSKEGYTRIGSNVRNMMLEAVVVQKNKIQGIKRASCYLWDWKGTLHC